MSKMISVKVDETLFKRLEECSRMRGVSKSSLIKEGIEMVLSEKAVPGGKEFFKSINKALRQKKSISIKVDWNEIIKELSGTRPKWKTLDEAMNYTRKRS